MSSTMPRCAARLLAAVAVSAGGILGGCTRAEKAEGVRREAEAPAPAGTPIDAADVRELAVRGCATCGGTRNDGQSFLEYEGKQYGFCCPGCMELFRKDPAKFIGAGGESPAEAETASPAEDSRAGDGHHGH